MCSSDLALSLPDGALGRTIAAVSIAMAVCVGLGAIVQLGRERGALLAEVLADAGYTLDGARWENPHWIGVEMHSARLAA